MQSFSFAAGQWDLFHFHLRHVISVGDRQEIITPNFRLFRASVTLFQIRYDLKPLIFYLDQLEKEIKTEGTREYKNAVNLLKSCINIVQ